MVVINVGLHFKVHRMSFPHALPVLVKVALQDYFHSPTFGEETRFLTYFFT